MALTPMMKQYLEIKEKYQDSILFFRLGDFYEMFMEDAVIASSILEIALTKRSAGLEEKVPMCGIPYHALNNYAGKLLDKGHKIAICEQVEDPKLTKGIVKRDVVKILTPGTIIEENLLKGQNNNYILSIYVDDGGTSLCYGDVSTGVAHGTFISKCNLDDKVIVDEIEKIDPREIIINSGKSTLESIFRNILISEFKDITLKQKFTYLNLPEEKNIRDVLIKGSHHFLNYINYNNKGDQEFITEINYYTFEEFLIIDNQSRKNLEIVKSLNGEGSENTLFSVLNKTNTASGSRLLKVWLNSPLRDIEEIRKRLSIVSMFKNDLTLSEKISNELKEVYDFERILSRLNYGGGSGVDLKSLVKSMEKTFAVKSIIREKIKSLTNEELKENLERINNKLTIDEEFYKYLDSAISETPPLNLKDGGIIKSGFHEELDTLRDLRDNSKTHILELERNERIRSGIKSLKIGFNKVFGYFIEITKSNLAQVPKDYVRKQTIANGERYIFGPLKDLEHNILKANESIVALEYEIFQGVRKRVLEEVGVLKVVSFNLSVLDVLNAFGKVSNLNDYVEPVLNDLGTFEFMGSRHPVVESLMQSNEFVKNDFVNSRETNNLNIITGPNMAGKSTYIRQIALVTIMAQVGSFVPCDSCEVSVVDRIFARVGASDDLSSGQSTFMVEMNEVSNILKFGTKNSLIILDEVGRGTSTLDGLSIAWAVCEHLIKVIGGTSIFATHYHELTSLEKEYENVLNYSMKVEENQKDVIFLHNIVKGSIDKSYGIHVGKLAGLPLDVIKRSYEKLEEFTKKSQSKQLALSFLDDNNEVKFVKEEPDSDKKDSLLYEKLGEFKKVEQEILDTIKEININEISPLEALNILGELQRKKVGK